MATTTALRNSPTALPLRGLGTYTGWRELKDGLLKVHVLSNRFDTASIVAVADNRRDT